MENLSIGHRLTDPNEALAVGTLLEVYERIATDMTLKAEILRLRKLAQLDKTAYRSLKTRLPYVVGSVFEGGKRHTLSFQAAHFFIIDLDDCPLEDGRLLAQIRQQESVGLAFLSPSGQGLKVFFALDTPCTDVKQFSEAYRTFASRFAQALHLEGSVDMRTSDAARACFLSHDPDVYFNPNALPIQWHAYLWNTPALSFDQTHPLEKQTKEIKIPNPINEEAYRAVLRKINPHAPVRREKQTHVPNILSEIEPTVREVCQKYNLELVLVQPLNFGLKFGVKQATRFAEINVFYGKKGFSVVRSPKIGTDPIIANVLYQAIYELLFPALIATDIDYTPVAQNN